MPIYEYHCPHCNKTIEQLTSMTSEPLTVCINCEKEGLERIISSEITFTGNDTPKFHRRTD